MAVVPATLSLLVSCAFAFAQSGGALKVWLPVVFPGRDVEPFVEIRVAMFWKDGITLRQIGTRIAANDAELATLIKEAREELREKKSWSLVIDADARVPWGEVNRVLEMARQDGIENIEFAIARTVQDADPHQLPASRGSGAAATGGQASRSSRANDKLDDPRSTTVRVFHREIGAGFSCDSFQKQLPCREESHWLLQAGGKEHTWDTLKAGLLEEARLEPQQPRRPQQTVQLSNREVTIRADLLGPYGHVQRILEICGNVGLYKVSVAALEPPARK